MVLIDFNKKYTSQHHNLIINVQNKQNTKNKLSIIFSSTNAKLHIKDVTTKYFLNYFR